MAALREALSMLIDSKATPIPIVEKAYGIHVAMLADKTLLDNASFILVVRADVPGETLRGRFGQQSKVGAVEHIRDMVNLQLPGIGLVPLPVAPRQLPYHAGSTYYELDRGSRALAATEQLRRLCLPYRRAVPGLELGLLGDPRIIRDASQ